MNGRQAISAKQKLRNEREVVKDSELTETLCKPEKQTIKNKIASIFE